MLCWFGMPSFWLKKTTIFDVLLIPPLLFLFCRMEIGIQKNTWPFKNDCRILCSPSFSIAQKGMTPTRFAPAPAPWPPPPTPKVKGQKKNAIFRHRFRRKNLSYRFLLILTARRRNYLFTNFLLYLRCGGALLLSVAKCIGLAMWMFIRSKELQINKYGRAELYCHCAVSFLLLLVKPRMIAK